MLKAAKNVFITIFFIFITHYIMVLIHVHLHTLLVWAFGYIKSPFDVSYLNIAVFLVDKETNFNILFQNGHNILAAVIALVPNIVNVSLFIICLSLISSQKIQEKMYLYYFLFWFMIMNIGQVYSYVYRSFQLPGDVQVFCKGLNISPYWVFLPGILFIIYSFYIILVHKIPGSYKILKISKLRTQAVFLFVCLLILFGYFGGLVYDIIYKQYFFLIYPLSLTILFFLICFPSNRWVQNRLQNLRH